jgi:hypothetical protein
MKRLIVFGFLFAVSAHAEVLDKSAVFAGKKVQYRIVIPQPYDAARAYPGVLAFVGGGQTYEMVRNEVDRTWKPEAERRGYIVVLPAAPDGQLFFEKGEDATLCGKGPLNPKWSASKHADTGFNTRSNRTNPT